MRHWVLTGDSTDTSAGASRLGSEAARARRRGAYSHVKHARGTHCPSRQSRSACGTPRLAARPRRSSPLRPAWSAKPATMR